MAGEAVARGYPFPLGTDLVRNGYLAIEQLADKVALDLGERGTTSSIAGVAAAANWTIAAGSLNGWRIGRLAFVTILATRTTSVLGPASATGALADTDVCTLSGVWAPAAMGTPALVVASWASGAAAGFAQITGAGVVRITDAHPGSSIAIGDAVRLTLVYPLAA